MKLSIIPTDNYVSVDGIGHFIDLSSFDLTNTHAVQWDNDAGEIEHIDDTPNTVIDNIDDYQEILDAYAAYILSLVPGPPAIEDIALEKHSLVQSAFKEKIAAGIVLDVLGSDHLYAIDDEAKVSILGLMLASQDSTYPCIDSNGVMDRRLHTFAQLQQLYTVGLTYIRDIYTHRDNLYNAVTAAYDADDSAALENMVIDFSSVVGGV